MNELRLHVITVDSENKPGVLYRISDILLRKKINVESLNVSEIKEGLSRFTITAKMSGQDCERIVNLIKKIVEVKSSEADANSQKISSIISGMEVTSIKKIEYMARAMKGVVSLAQGVPSFNTGKEIREEAKKAIDGNLVDRYAHYSGITELREAVSLKVSKKNNIPCDKDQVIITHGVTEGAMAVFMTLFNPGDEVVILSPAYALHITQLYLAMHGKKPIFVPLKETKTDWEFDPKALEAAITPFTKAIVVCNPSNPTGKVYSEKELREIAKIALKRDLYIISDEIYEDFIYEGKHLSIGSFKEVKDRVISLFGFSKSYAMTGWRVGYIVANKDLTANIAKAHDTLITCPTVVSQYAALGAFKIKKEDFRKYIEAFERRRNLVMSFLAKTKKLEFVEPKGSYYIFPKIKAKVDDSKLAMELVKEAKVAVVPGSTFGKGGENHIRICFAMAEDVLEEGVKRFVKYVEKNL